MILKVIVGDQLLELNVPTVFIERAREFFDKMDSDMDNGWQMSRDWVDHPDQMQRCQIVADKLLGALENENHELGRMMAGYILARLPEVDTIELDTSGEMQNHHFQFQHDAPKPTGNISVSAPPTYTPEAVRQVDKEISQVFKMGKQYKFSIMDPETGEWSESPAFGDKEEAEQQRNQVLRRRLNELSRVNH